MIKHKKIDIAACIETGKQDKLLVSNNKQQLSCIKDSLVHKAPANAGS